jgi:hypothetical protein
MTLVHSLAIVMKAQSYTLTSSRLHGMVLNCPGHSLVITSIELSWLYRSLFEIEEDHYKTISTKSRTILIHDDNTLHFVLLLNFSDLVESDLQLV